MRKIVIAMLAVALVVGVTLIVEGQQPPRPGGGMRPPMPPGPPMPPPGTPMPPSGMPMPPQLPEELVKEFDKDGDGKLSPEEQKAAMEEWHKRILKEFDKDGDGKLSKEEQQAMNESVRTKFIEGLFKKTDADGNSELSLEELKAALKKVEEANKEGAEKKGDSAKTGEQPAPPRVGDPEVEGARKPAPPSGEKVEEAKPQAPAAQPERGTFAPPAPPGELLKGLIKGFGNFDKDKSAGLSLEETKTAVQEILKAIEKQKQSQQTPPAPQGGDNPEGNKQPNPPPVPPGLMRPGHRR